VSYLSKAASNAAVVESLALQAGLKKGGAAKGELVLAIFELANCFRHGWGMAKDPIAAKQVRCRSLSLLGILGQWSLLTGLNL
jgi:TPR repeat protein